MSLDDVVPFDVEAIGVCLAWLKDIDSLISSFASEAIYFQDACDEAVERVAIEGIRSQAYYLVEKLDQSQFIEGLSTLVSERFKPSQVALRNACACLFNSQVAAEVDEAIDKCISASKCFRHEAKLLAEILTLRRVEIERQERKVATSDDSTETIPNDIQEKIVQAYELADSLLGTIRSISFFKDERLSSTVVIAGDCDKETERKLFESGLEKIRSR